MVKDDRCGVPIAEVVMAQSDLAHFKIILNVTIKKLKSRTIHELWFV